MLKQSDRYKKPANDRINYLFRSMYKVLSGLPEQKLGLDHINTIAIDNLTIGI
jgi:hypothetical protein